MEFFAYIDPSTGSLFIQVAIGGVLAVVVMFRNFIRNAFYKLKLVTSRSKATNDEEA